MRAKYACQTANIRRPLVGNKIVDHFDVVGASAIDEAPTTSSFSTEQLASMDWAGLLQQDGAIIWVWLDSPDIRVCRW